jgi:hypothetical protein
VGPLQGFRSKLGKPFAAVIVLTPALEPKFDFGQDRTDSGSTAAPVDFTGQEPLGKCPKCGGRVFDTPMNYLCENAVGASRTCNFRSGKIILQRPIEREQMQKLLETGKTDLLEKFISRKGRPFKAFLVAKDGNVEFEFEPREPKARKPAAKAGQTAEPEPKVDFTGQQSLGKCPLCGKRVFEGNSAYVCEQSQVDKKPCKFKVNKMILQQPIDREQVARLLSKGKTDLFQEFISAKSGRPFPAYLVMDEEGKVTFDFPPREDQGKPAPAK